MINLIDLVQHLDVELESSLFQDYAPNGLQVEGRREIKKIATAVTASLATIQEAAKEQVDALIVHHGLFWKGDPYPVIGTKKEKLKILLDSGISLLSYHLPLDAHRGFGNNWLAAKEMGWEDLEPFGEMNGRFIGVMGKIASLPREEFKKSLELYYNHPAHVAFGGSGVVRTAALISGGAYREIASAKKASVDCFITGNFDEPAWHLAFEEGVNFFALGHSATERVGPKGLLRHLSWQFKVETLYLEDINPF